jgi:hypothetical protein
MSIARADRVEPAAGAHEGEPARGSFIGFRRAPDRARRSRRRDRELPRLAERAGTPNGLICMSSTEASAVPCASTPPATTT